MRILFIADLMHSGHRVLPLCEELINNHLEVVLLTPKVRESQKKHINFPKSLSGVHIQVPHTRSFYNLFPEFPKLQFAFKSLLEKLVIILRPILNVYLRRYSFSFPDAIIDESFLWLRPFLRHASDIEVNADFVVSTYSPIGCHLIAKEISQKLNVPWVADYRDLYSLNHTLVDDEIKGHRAIVDAEIFDKCASITTVSSGFAREIETQFGKSCQVIPNFVKSAPPLISTCVRSNRPWSIAYTGSIYPGYQNIELLLRAASKHPMLMQNFEFYFLGQSASIVKKMVRGKDAFGGLRYRFIDTLDLTSSRKLQERADFLLLLNWEDANSKGVIPTKLIEYLFAGRPIIAIGGHAGDDVEMIIQQANGGFVKHDFLEIERLLFEISQKTSFRLELNNAYMKTFTASNAALRFESIFRSIQKGRTI